ncbi:hypothetical protein [Nocardioides kongjuensis]|uniref:hypothetical protein n=1 Tax=Nocardioides kongjuensis TaxID=349522 RepID=UPI0031E5D3CF
MIIGMLQPVLYLLLFGPLLEPVIAQLGGNKYTWSCPHARPARHLRGLLRRFSLIGEWREGVIEAERVTPRTARRCCSAASTATCSSSSSRP